MLIFIYAIVIVNMKYLYKGTGNVMTIYIKWFT
jgi:hypothetical protein